MKTGERIRRAREKKEVTQQELADAVGTTKQNIYKYENGIVTNIPSDNIEKITNPPSFIGLRIFNIICLFPYCEFYHSVYAFKFHHSYFSIIVCSYWQFFSIIVEV